MADLEDMDLKEALEVFEGFMDGIIDRLSRAPEAEKPVMRKALDIIFKELKLREDKE